MPILVLYEHPLSPYAQKVKIALREKGLPFEARMPEGIGAGHTKGEFADANPRREVPALIHGDTAIFDSTVILEYIEDKWPQPPLLPEAPAARAHARQIEDVMDTHFEAITWGLGELHFFRRGDEAVRKVIEARAGQQIAGFMAWLDGKLDEDDWFSGDDFGRADLSVIPYLNAADGFGYTPVAGSRLDAWMARANGRDSVSQTDAESRASITGMQMVSAAVEAGLFKRQYRDHRLEWMIKSGGMDIVQDGLAKGTIRFTDHWDT
ncbi:MAG: glutathione S-transferase [Hyphomonas sp. BRH_c22]|uniref:glutathione S-transferase family protein n=1 Tax=Hyphomonas sp. BRH_c22 TaxID=1629710 RepID=UPI00061FA9C4|nr:glutathione S-transferase family protein [Hyphomonas sp. BRH_c22]KJS39290.1 MAG: glutathione S-transferase [Hyphomonas sp. BRH_c22]